MLISKYNPFKELSDLNKRFNDLTLTFPSFDLEESSIAGFKPSANTIEGEFSYHIEVDLPGVNKEDIKVDIEDNTLKISGERSFKKEVKKDDYYKMETSFGKFQRNFLLPDNVDKENINANSKDGVLEVVLPKLKDKNHEKKKIKVS